jgi:hypothetical protein
MTPIEGYAEKERVSSYANRAEYGKQEQTAIKHPKSGGNLSRNDIVTQT